MQVDDLRLYLTMKYNNWWIGSLIFALTSGILSGLTSIVEQRRVLLQIL